MPRQLQEDWNEDSRQKQNPSSTKTKLMEARERHRFAAYEPKPEDVDAIGYGMFFDSMFELADAMVGRGEQGGLSFALTAMSTLSDSSTIVLSYSSQCLTMTIVCRCH